MKPDGPTSWRHLAPGKTMTFQHWISTSYHILTVRVAAACSKVAGGDVSETTAAKASRRIRHCYLPSVSGTFVDCRIPAAEAGVTAKWRCFSVMSIQSSYWRMEHTPTLQRNVNIYRLPVAKCKFLRHTTCISHNIALKWCYGRPLWTYRVTYNAL